jgi:LPXTG-motif cell wall-anchored protein
VIAAVIALAIPAGAKGTAHTDFGLTGEARALELAVGSQGVSLGLSIARADSKPSSVGVGAGQCTLLGDSADPDDLPCSDESTVTTRYPGTPGDGTPKCAAALPAPINTIVDLKLACGSSKSGLARSLPFTASNAKVGHLGVKLPIGAVLDALPVGPLVDDLTDTLAPVLDLAPQQVQDAVDNVLELVTGIAETDALAVEIGPSSSQVSSKGNVISVDSSAAGALIGLVGIPEVAADGTAISATADPLTNGLVIIEIGTARASASLNTVSATAAGAASPALVTVKVRDITKPEPTYVEVSVAPGQTLTVLGGTPAESTITAADSTVEENGSTAAAGADAVRLHLLKGVQGGVTLGIARATAAVKGDVVKPAAPIKKAPPQTLPVTGAANMTLPALGLILLAGAALWARRRLSA